ncbi:MAG: hypothetical protein DMF91_02110 [Acidobacteria bacterium]|nr:MAG: hypothetical protein DMF91_02110 [Acidobacteriota bacterium]
MIIKARKAAGVAIAAFFFAALVASMAVRHAPPSLSAEGDESERWFISQRAFPAREIPAGVLERAVAALRVFPKVRANLAIPGDTWASIGPQAINDPVTRSTWSGRVMTLAPHPTDPDTLYLGADLGGVWKTTDAGQTWSMVTPDLAFPAIRWLAIDPINPDILYAATPPGAYASRFLRTIDAGRSWQEVPLTDDQGKAVKVLYKILIDPRRAGSPATSTLYLQRGGWLYRSDDGGKTLRTVLTMPDAGVVTNAGPEFLEDVALDPAHPDTLFAISVPYVCNSPCSNPDPGILLYRSIDGGAHWTKQRIVGGITDVVPETRIAVLPGATNLLVAFRDSTAQKVRLMRSTDLGDTWSEVTTLKPSSFAWPTTVAMNPTADTMYLGNLGLNRSTDEGQTWLDMSAIHADETVLAFDASGRLLLGSDGGLFRAGSPGGSWTSLNNGLTITECYSVAAHPTDSARVMIGTQDNGTIERQGASGWNRIAGGDGGEVIYDPGGAISYLETQWDSTANSYNFYQCTGGSCARRVAGITMTDLAPFIPRFTMDPSNAATLYLTAEHLYRTDTRGGTWSAVTQSVKDSQRCWQDPTQGQQCAKASYFTAVAVSRTSSQVVYAGTRNGDVWASIDRGATWKSVAGTNAGPLPVRPVNEIAVDPDDPRIAYVVVGGFDVSGAGRGHVFRTADGGDTWRDLSGNLPDVNVSALLIDPEAKPRVLYLGTDLGVFRATDDGSGTWQSYNDGLPPVVVTRFAYNAATRTLLAATYGRGVWAISDRFSSNRLPVAR